MMPLMFVIVMVGAIAASVRQGVWIPTMLGFCAGVLFSFVLVGGAARERARRQK